MKLPKLKYWYHATDFATAEQIIASGHLIPQAHKGNTTLGVFFANSAENAGYFLMLRGIKQYVVFKVPRNRFDKTKMFPGGADRMPEELGIVCMRHLGAVPVNGTDAMQVQDNRTCNIPGVVIRTQGTHRLGMEIVDLAEFEAYIEANPELKAMIEQEQHESNV
jgi:hypothetical protein